MPGITFDGTAPMMEGTWFNPKTGDVVKIRDTFFENNNYIARTTDGRMLNYNQLQNYIRDDSKSLKKPVQEQKTPAKPASNSTPMGGPSTPKVNPDAMLSAEDLAMLDGLEKPAEEPMFDQAKARHISPEQHAEIEATHRLQNGMAERMNGISDHLDQRGQEITISDQIINRAMEDEDKPKLVVQVSWNAPAEKLKFLKQNMGIKDSDIVRWITRTLDSRDLSSDVRDSVAEWVDSLFEKEPKPAQTHTEEKPKGPLKVPKKKVPSKKK